MGRLDKETTKAARQQALQWQPRDQGRKGLYLPSAGAFPFESQRWGGNNERNNCIYWCVGDKDETDLRVHGPI